MRRHTTRAQAKTRVLCRRLGTSTAEHPPKNNMVTLQHHVLLPGTRDTLHTSSRLVSDDQETNVVAFL